ncbi:MAG: helix-turn-helix transcriptional regulator [Microbacteriaceae bacterium]|nr:helix-turn-helix transcriptional regulator [Microbacteriaceae bacterium]
MFAAHGYATTSIDAIAQSAGVAQRTVYAAFGSKREILSAICEAWLARARAREAAAEVLAEPDPLARLRGAGAWLADLYGAGLDVAIVLESASDESPETQQLLRAKLAGRDRVMNDFIRSLGPALAVPTAEAQALFRALAAPGVYRELVEHAGWGRDRFAAWVAETLERTILHA